MFDAFLSNYGLNYDLAERTTRVLRRGIDLFSKTALPVAPSVIARMSVAFEATGYPSFLWIAGKIIGRYGNDSNPALKSAIKEIFERSTSKVVSLLHIKTPGEIPDSKSSVVKVDETEMKLSAHIPYPYSFGGLHSNAPPICYFDAGDSLHVNCLSHGIPLCCGRSHCRSQRYHFRFSRFLPQYPDP